MNAEQVLSRLVLYTGGPGMRSKDAALYEQDIQFLTRVLSSKAIQGYLRNSKDGE